MMKIGNVTLANNLSLAPMLGVNCTAFRLMCRNYGAGIVYSPMIHAMRLVKGERNRDVVIDFVKEERPIAIQLVGRQPDMIKQAIGVIEDFADIIDINFGCPDSDVIGEKMGAYFSKHPEQISKVLCAAVSATNKPVTAKIRIGWDSQSINHLKQAKIVQDCGAAAIAVHGRTKEQKYAGKANWAAIRQVKEKVNIPVIGNGDVWCANDARSMLDKTGCDGVMIGRGAMGNPYLFKQCEQLISKGKLMPDLTTAKKGDLLMEFIELYNEFQVIRRFPEIKQHAMWFCTGTDGAAHKRRELMHASDENELVSMIKSLFY
ncbi:MAG: tRNA dihydrouridine synthase DusB [Nanoarchaeota archaeon]|nr:tRNA dihydrouridine synthase DusB [Nanoarchaeota archaeon]